MNRLDDKIALTTGDARGMGAAEADLLVQAGANVFFTDLDESLGQTVAEEIGDNSHFRHQNLTSEESWRRVVENWKRNSVASTP